MITLFFQRLCNRKTNFPGFSRYSKTTAATAAKLKTKKTKNKNENSNSYKNNKQKQQQPQYQEKETKKQISKQTGTECSNFWVGIIDLRESLP